MCLVKKPKKKKKNIEIKQRYIQCIIFSKSFSKVRMGIQLCKIGQDEMPFLHGFALVKAFYVNKCLDSQSQTVYEIDSTYLYL